MARIVIEFDIKNARELVKREKGFFAGVAASFLFTPDRLKNKVESIVTQEMVKVLEENIVKGFEEKGVVAEVKIKGEVKE